MIVLGLQFVCIWLVVSRYEKGIAGLSGADADVLPPEADQWRSVAFRGEG